MKIILLICMNVFMVNNNYKSSLTLTNFFNIIKVGAIQLRIAPTFIVILQE
jgi:hypothetical protein